MSDYNFSGLSTRSFEQMIQAISTKLIGPNIIVFGDGPDGGREATFEGAISYPSVENQWNGYGVIQAKFLQRPQATKDQGEWALSQLRSELQAFADSERDRKKPEYYIFVTNAVLSAVKDVGAKDKAKAVFDEFKSTIPLKDYDVWDYDKLRAFVDNNSEVRKKYAAFITAGDVLAEVMERLEFERADFESILTNFLEKELLTDQFANLEQAGHATNDRIPIARVFTDLPTNSEPVIEPSEESSTSLAPGFITSIVEIAKERLNPSIVVTEASSLQIATKMGRLVLIGGPGQGKTTVGQFCCQLFRTALLKDRPQHLITPPAKGVVNEIISFCAQEEIEMPLARRFPLRIQLSAFASALASKDQSEITSVLSYLTEIIAKRTNLTLSVKDFREWLRNYPWLIILDGLDEVPSSTNRQDVLSAIQDFWVDAAQLDADLLVIATTRPQGYNEDFSPRYYEHKWLMPLSNARALRYGKLLAHARHGNDSDRCSQIIKRLTRASEHPATARLMRSPLQVTIMGTLVERMGTPPQERWQLFKSYYDIIYMREMERDIPAAVILRDYRSDIDAIHNMAGLLLQVESERKGRTNAQLAADKFAAVVNARLESEGHEGSELEDLRDRIIDAATNRLVFLVGLQQNKIGFEIRSLQEFMAAEALMDGKDEIIRSRLSAIAVIAHWRNVFLFAAGKCFAVQQALRDTIVAIAAQLNEDLDDSACVANLAGSQLSLDLLADGSSGRQPKYGRILARIALRILQLPPSEYQRQLGALYDEQFEEIYRQELIKALDSSIPEHRLGGWVCLFNLIDSGIKWAESLGERYWSTAQNVEDLFHVMPFVSFRSAPSWFTNKIIEMLPRISPKVLDSALRGSETLMNFLRESDDELLTAISAVSRIKLRKGNEICIKVASEPLARSTRDFPVFFNTPIQGSYRAKVRPLIDFPSPTTDWLPIVEAARFLEKPNKVNLAATLKVIAADFNADRSKQSFLKLPWPLSACLGICETAEDVNALAKRVESGDLGDFQDWALAEERWETQGLTSSDFEYMTDERLPFTSSIATIGFPFSDFSLAFSVSSVETLQVHITGLLEVYRKVNGYRVKSLISHVLLFAMNFLQGRKAGATIELSAEEFRRLIADAVGGGNRVWASAVGAISLTDPISKEWIEAFDFLGQQKSISSGLTNASTIKLIHHTFLRNFRMEGLMRLLALTAAHVSLPFIYIPFEMIDPEHLNDRDSRNAATILLLKQDTGVVSTNAALVKSTAALFEDHPELDIASLHVGEPTRRLRVEDRFWFAVLDELPPSDWISRHQIMRRFDESLSVRTSGLDQPQTWESLQLPIALRHFFQTESQPN